MSCSGMVLWSKRRTVWDGHLLMKPLAMGTEALVSGERGGDREKEGERERESGSLPCQFIVFILELGCSTYLTQCLLIGLPSVVVR